MILVVCADEQNGLLFNNRRLSRDSAVCAHLLDYCGDKTLWMSRYSASIFPCNVSNIQVSENFFDAAEVGDVCFAEDADVKLAIERAEAVVIYRWNRRYPSDIKLPEAGLSGRTLVSKVNFAGNSHPCITQEVYK